VTQWATTARVVLRDLPDDGEEGSAQRGVSHFHFGYRPFQEKGRTIFLFHEAPEQPVLTNRIASLFPPDKGFPLLLAGSRRKDWDF
jgi:hypothetical protein